METQPDVIPKRGGAQQNVCVCMCVCVCVCVCVCECAAEEVVKEAEEVLVQGGRGSRGVKRDSKVKEHLFDLH